MGDRYPSSALSRSLGAGVVMGTGSTGEDSPEEKDAMEAESSELSMEVTERERESHADTGDGEGVAVLALRISLASYNKQNGTITNTHGYYVVNVIALGE